ncbi:hypothetical protein Lal_00030016 [Lupinus albus]|nr:hypothetical protein Lal_00030016 [Lupinus albus]
MAKGGSPWLKPNWTGRHDDVAVLTVFTASHHGFTMVLDQEQAGSETPSIICDHEAATRLHEAGIASNRRSAIRR